MKNRLKQVVLVAAGILPLVAVARSVPASSGRAVLWSDGSCFAMGYSAMANNCTTSKSFEIPLSADSSGNKSVVVYAQGASASSNVGCAAYGLNREATLIYGDTTRKWLPAFPEPEPISLPNAYVPAYGYLYVNCTVLPGGRVISVGYNQ